MRKKTLKLSDIKEKIVERVLCSYRTLESDKSLELVFSSRKHVGTFVVRWNGYSEFKPFRDLEKAINFYNKI